MIDFTIRPDDGDEYTVTADSRDIYLWEKTHRKGKTFQTLMNDLAMVDLYTIAYQASKRAGLCDGTEAEFARTCVLEFEIEEEEPDPTRPAASAAR